MHRAQTEPIYLELEDVYIIVAPHESFDEESARVAEARGREKALAEALKAEFISILAEAEEEKREKKRQERERQTRGWFGGGGGGEAEAGSGIFNFNHMLKKIRDNVQVRSSGCWRAVWCVVCGVNSAVAWRACGVAWDGRTAEYCTRGDIKA